MKDNKCVYFFTQAYNAEKTIERTIKSVLMQSYSNVVYYIADSASTDHTKEIILHYAETDERVRPILCEKNDEWEMYNVLPRILTEDSEGYFVQIDADDEYAFDFVKKVLDFMEDAELEIASCTSAYVNGLTGEDVSKLILQDKIIIEGDTFQTAFPEYFKYFRDSWGKVFSLRAFKDVEYFRFDKKIMTGSVSYLCFEALLNAKKVGVYPEQLHRYYIYSDSFERAAKSYKRILTPKLYEYYYNFLVRKCGEISLDNERFLIGSYCNSICGKIRNFNLTDMEPEEIARISEQMFGCGFMRIVKEKGSAELLEKMRRSFERLLGAFGDINVDNSHGKKLREIAELFQEG